MRSVPASARYRRPLAATPLAAAPLVAAFLAIAILALGAAGCGRTGGRPEITIGSRCTACGMAIHDTHFACVRGADGKYRQYDSIECLLRDGPPRAGESIYLPDYDGQRLCASDSVWVVKGSFPTPMGGGLAAFASERSARDVSARVQGRVGRLHQFLSRMAP